MAEFNRDKLRRVKVYERQPGEIVAGRTKMVKVEKCEGYFHQWGCDYNEFSGDYGSNAGNFSIAIIELESGEMITAEVEMVEFV